MNQTLFAQDALLPSGWATNVLLQWNHQGQLTDVQANAVAPPGVPQAPGPVLPGMPNLHSHAFQRAFAGLTEYRVDANDNFWSWRTLMYRFALALTPDQLEAIATWLYIEMLEAGYTQVCEFHYLHHDSNGQPYADDATLATCLLRAAQNAGIALTLLPVLYQSSGFGGTSPSDGQRRFIRSTDNMLNLLAKLKPLCEAQSARLGLAPHSLRAVPPVGLRETIAGLDAMDKTAPIHIHIAEQTAEVDACVAWRRQRPVEWLLNHADVDPRWCLVHATHMSEQEYQRAASSGAVAGLCPSTEANLGDGLFNVPRWLSHGGAWGVGSDSHITVNAAEELMLMEYGQRLALRQRNVLAHPHHHQTAPAMTLAAVAGGVQAAGRATPGPSTGLALGQPADMVALDAGHHAMVGLSAPEMLSAHVFASNRTSALHSVWVGGQARVLAGRHALRESAAQAFLGARRALIAES